MMDFARTRMGAALLEGTIPRIAKALERIRTHEKSKRLRSY